jgi:hypothetical protein
MLPEVKSKIKVKEFTEVEHWFSKMVHHDDLAFRM